MRKINRVPNRLNHLMGPDIGGLTDDGQVTVSPGTRS